MAKLVGTFFHSHGGTTSMDPVHWRERRLSRPIRDDVPVEDDETNLAKGARIHEGFRVLREKVAELEADVIVVFSDDQLECFDFSNYPAFSVFAGERFRKGWPRPGREPSLNTAGRHAEAGAWFRAIRSSPSVFSRG
jgi:hypothetical protein